MVVKINCIVWCWKSVDGKVLVGVVLWVLMLYEYVVVVWFSEMDG